MMDYSFLFLVTINILFYGAQSLTTTTKKRLSTARNIENSDSSSISPTASSTITNLKHSLKNQQRFVSNSNDKKHSCKNLCPEPPEDTPDLDRREAAFALLGSLWSMTTTITSGSNPVYAVHRENAKVEVPDMVGGMNDRVNQGPDSEILLTSLEKSIIALNSIPYVINAKKWSKVTSVLTGPMGTLVGTMKKLSLNAEDIETASLLTKKVEEDLYSMSAAVERKQVEKALTAQGLAMDTLNEFIVAL